MIVRMMRVQICLYLSGTKLPTQPPSTSIFHKPPAEGSRATRERAPTVSSPWERHMLSGPRGRGPSAGDHVSRAGVDVTPEKVAEGAHLDVECTL